MLAILGDLGRLHTRYDQGPEASPFRVICEPVMVTGYRGTSDEVMGQTHAGGMTAVRIFPNGRTSQNVLEDEEATVSNLSHRALVASQAGKRAGTPALFILTDMHPIVELRPE